MSETIKARIEAALDNHPQLYDSDACGCAENRQPWTAHIADVLISELGLAQQWAAETDGGRSSAYDNHTGALRSYETIVHNNTTYHRNQGRIPDFARNPRIVTRYVTAWEETEIPTPAIAFTICCRDRRYCANAAITITAADQADAHMDARNQGWLIHTANDQTTCPACQTGRHPRKDQP